MQFWEENPRHPLDPTGTVATEVAFRHVSGLHVVPSTLVMQALEGLDVSVYFRGPSYEGVFPHDSAIGLMAFAGFYLSGPTDFTLLFCGPDRESACEQFEALFDPEMEGDGYGTGRLHGECRRIQG